MVGHVTAPAAAPLGALPSWVTLVRAPNPGPMTLDGTNTWVLRAPGEEFAIVVDPGPLDEGHLAAIAAHAPVGFILVTHGHLITLRAWRTYPRCSAGSTWSPPMRRCPVRPIRSAATRHSVASASSYRR
jgi:hypothetical protein